MPAPQQPARTGARSRWIVLAALAALIFVVAMWLSNCIPGFGRGSSGAGEGDSKAADAKQAEPAKSEPTKTEPAKPEPAKPEPPKPELELPEPPDPEPPDPEGGARLTVTIDVGGCSVPGSEPVECSKMCERVELFTNIDDAVLEVAGASHGSVVAMIDCLKSKGIDKVAIRRE